jgi:GT2 family glycosyltransferase
VRTSCSAWIVLLAYNGLDDTRKCLASLAELEGPPCSTLLVDNGSRDGVLDVVKTEFPWCHTLRLPLNLGPSAGNNRGIAYALDHGADFVLLLNNDTIVAPDLVARLMEASARLPGFGLLGPIINWMDEPQLVMTDGVRFNPPGFPGFFARQPVVPRTTTPPSVTEVDVVNACCMLVRAEVFRRIGLLDERFFMYHDETDFCLRTRAAGFRCGIVSEQLVWHKGSSTARQSGRSFQRYYDARNLGLVLLKHRGARHHGRTVVASALTYFRYLYHRYCHECEAEERDAARAVIHGLSDVLRGRFGPRGAPSELIVTALRLLFDALRTGRSGLAQVGRVVPVRHRADRPESS